MQKKLIIISISILVSFSLRGFQIHMRIAKGNTLQGIFFYCRTLSLSCCLYQWPFFFSHFIVSVCVIGGGAVFWMGLLTIHKAFSSFCWKKAQLKSVSLPFRDMGMRWDQSRRMKAPKLPVSSCFPQRRFYFFSPKDDASFQGLLICKLFPQFISLQ